MPSPRVSARSARWSPRSSDGEQQAPPHGIPEWTTAQQAIAFLHLTLLPGRLIDRLLAAADLDDETEALTALKGTEVMFRSPAWAQVAMPDQQIAARFILGRAAMLRVRYTAGASAGAGAAGA